MTGTLVSLVDSVQARQTCPACEGPRQPHSLPTQWHHTRAIFACGAVFIARGEAIEAERPCGDRSKLAAELWTVEAKGHGRAICVARDRDEDGEIARLILELSMASVRAGFDALTICEIIRGEMQAFAARQGEGTP